MDTHYMSHTCTLVYRACLSVTVSVDLLSVRMSQRSLSTLLTTVQLLSECILQGSCGAHGTRCDNEEKEEKRKMPLTPSSCLMKEGVVIKHFLDDLRVNDFKYVVDDSGMLGH